VGSTVDCNLVFIVDGVEVDRPSCGASEENAEHWETV